MQPPRKLFAHLLFFIMYTISTSAYNLFYISSFSSVVGPSFKKLIGGSLNSSRSKFVYIPTAGYAFDPSSPRSKGEQRRRSRYDARQKMGLIASQLSLSESLLLELDAPTMTPSLLLNSLDDAKLIYVDGGNTFYLQKYILQTGFWESVKSALGSGAVYIGASAGAIVAGRSIETAYWKGWDNPAAAEGMVWTQQSLEGSNLSGRGVSYFMHHDPALHSDLLAEKIPSLGHPVETVANNEVLCTSFAGGETVCTRFTFTDSVADISASTMI